MQMERRQGALAGTLVVILAFAALHANLHAPVPIVQEPGGQPVNLGSLPVHVPALPFPDNPDPTQCGIPTVWGLDDPAWISGYYQGELVPPMVYLYDSHLRTKVVGQIPHGGCVRIKLSQANPTLHYYLVRSLDLEPIQEGWIPAPFVSFEPVSSSTSSST